MAYSLAPEMSAPTAQSPFASWGTARWAFIAWLLCCAIMIWLFRKDFGVLGFYDPDDALRLQEVRDWLAGQSFFDVSQHRVNPPVGGPMHWSRIVDLPIGALVLLARPLIGPAYAEIFACVVTPLLLLGGAACALYHMAKRIGGGEIALMSVVLLLATPTILIQYMPFRIDHHGWQISMAAVALAGVFDPRQRRGGIISALAIALWLQISSEGLPYAALLAGLFGLRFLMARDQGLRFASYALTLGSAALALLAATRGLQAPFDPHCDVLSLAYVWPLVIFSAATAIGMAVIAPTSTARRFAILSLGAGAAVLLFAMVGGKCVSGDPFQALGPIAYKHWYMQIMEGRPIWEQDLVKAGVIALPSLIGLLSAFLAMRNAAPHSQERTAWLVLIVLILGTAAVAIMVMRALSVAHLAALPSTAWLILRLLKRIQASPKSIVRIVGSVSLMALTPAGICALWGVAVAKPDKPKSGLVSCQSVPALRSLGTVPAATLFAPVDMGPDILVKTHHSVIATGHHRNAAGITEVIQGFMARPDAARGLIARLRDGRGADYVIACNNLNEFNYYAKASPHGLAAMLAKGRHPDWLEPVSGEGPVRIFRILPQSGTKASATPFMQ
ncbi:hypothetical protein [Sphingobium sp. EM0848]|uniref:hypothetical protein n=1 Tax=Sphingobium sp. EM0848 TaxID=2743473 RepID=UPI00210084B3|nr:hypothetical protein [Sphingobium sp. EM0848]